jgi:hypothetical protein
MIQAPGVKVRIEKVMSKNFIDACSQFSPDFLLQTKQIRLMAVLFLMGKVG